MYVCRRLLRLACRRIYNVLGGIHIGASFFEKIRRGSEADCRQNEPDTPHKLYILFSIYKQFSYVVVWVLHMFDVIVVGAGPAGSHVAELLSLAGLKVIVLEKKPSVGKTACSGLISTRIEDLVPVENGLIENLIQGVEFHCGDKAVRMKKGRIAAFVMDRAKFDNYLLTRAKRAGATVRMSEPFVNYSLTLGSVVVNGKYRAKVLVGADGAASLVRNASGLPGKLEFMNGAIAYFDEPDSGQFVDVFYDNKYSPDFFAWRIPRGESVEYGVASKKDHIGLLRKFLKSQNRSLQKYYAHPMVSGVQETAGERLILVGDAAAQVKPFSGGGIIYGLLCAKTAASAILLAHKNNDFTKAFFEQHYDRKWKAKLLDKMELGSMVLGSIKSINDREKALLFGIIESKKSEAEEFGDMDFL